MRQMSSLAEPLAHSQTKSRDATRIARFRFANVIQWLVVHLKIHQEIPAACSRVEVL